MRNPFAAVRGRSVDPLTSPGGVQLVRFGGNDAEWEEFLAAASAAAGGEPVLTIELADATLGQPGLPDSSSPFLLVSERLLPTGRIHRESGKWGQGNPFEALAVAQGAGWARIVLPMRLAEEHPAEGHFQHNLALARVFYRWVFLRAANNTDLPPAWDAWLARHAQDRVELWCDEPSEADADSGFANAKLRGVRSFEPTLRLQCQEGAARWRSPHRACAGTLPEVAQLWRQWSDLRYLTRNEPSPGRLWARRLWIPALLVALLVGFGLPVPLQEDRRQSRSVVDAAGLAARRIEVPVANRLEAWRAARYALFRFQRRFPSEGAIRAYLNDQLRPLKIPLEGESWPDSVRKLSFPFPKAEMEPFSERERLAYDYLTGLLTDSLVYPTDHWWTGDLKRHRTHRAVDIGAVPGTAILAPFSGRAFTGEGYLGGVFIGVEDSKNVVLLAHCDKLFFLDGDSVRAGDAVGTVGMTGRTGGPHTHMAFGRLSDKGSSELVAGRSIAWEDPVAWFHRWSQAPQAAASSMRSASSAGSSSPAGSSGSSGSPDRSGAGKAKGASSSGAGKSAAP